MQRDATGDKAKAKGDYRDAIESYLKWKNAVIEMNDGDETCADLRSHKDWTGVVV